MFSVFHNYLEPLCGSDDGKKPSEIYNQLRNTYNQGVKGILYSTRMIVPDIEEEGADEVLQLLIYDPGIRLWLKFFNREVTLKIGLYDYRQSYVGQRIVLSMLDGMLNRGYIQRKHHQWIQNHIISTTRREWGLINTEDLPF